MLPLHKLVTKTLPFSISWNHGFLLSLSVVQSRIIMLSFLYSSILCSGFLPTPVVSCFYHGAHPLTKGASLPVFHLNGLAEVRTGMKHFSATPHNCHGPWTQGNGTEAKNGGRYKNTPSNRAVQIHSFFFKCHCQRIGWMLRCPTSHTLRLLAGQ